MKKITFVSLLVLLLSFSINSSFAQKHTKTAYEKKVSEIENRYHKKIQQAKLRGEGGLMIISLALQMDNELKRAKKLKTKIDFQREKQKSFEQSDYGEIYKKVKLSFEKWSKKGEFEKKEDWLNRLENEAKNAFDKICIEEISELAYNRLVTNKHQWECELLSYNTEKETFPISFGKEKLKWNTIIKIPISEARQFKESFSWSMDYHYVGILQNAVFPEFFTVSTSNKEYEIQTIQKGVDEPIISFDKLDIKNEFLKGYTFNYTTYKKEQKKKEEERKEQERKEQERKEQEKIKEQEKLLIEYNKKLIALQKLYNEDLLKNAYNIKKYKIETVEKIIVTKASFDDESRWLAEKYVEIKNKIEQNFEESYKRNKHLFKNKEEFASCYQKGKEFIDKEIAIRWIKINKRIIKGLNLQEKEDASVKAVLTTVQNYKGSSFYPQFLFALIQNNKKLNKEWRKNSKYFQNQEEFYNTYISGNYKNILKTKKRK